MFGTIIRQLFIADQPLGHIKVQNKEHRINKAIYYNRTIKKKE